jgi:hypothetical protein
MFLGGGEKNTSAGVDLVVSLLFCNLQQLNSTPTSDKKAQEAHRRRDSGR